MNLRINLWQKKLRLTFLSRIDTLKPLLSQRTPQSGVPNVDRSGPDSGQDVDCTVAGCGPPRAVERLWPSLGTLNARQCGRPLTDCTWVNKVVF